MARTITYTDTVQVPKATLDSVRDIAHNWHDPAAGNYFVYLREEAAIGGDGTHVTDGGGDPLYNVSIAAQIRGVAEDDLPTQIDNLVSAINTSFPDDWPTVDEAEVSLQ